MDPNVVFKRIVRFIVDAHRDALRNQWPSVAERREQTERFHDLSIWTDNKGFLPDPVISDGRRWRWNAAQQCVESEPYYSR